MPPHAVVLTMVTFRALEPPCNAPAVKVTAPFEVCVSPDPRLSVPPVPFMVSPAKVAFPLNVTVPAVRENVSNPVVVKPLTVFDAVFAPTNRTCADKSVIVPVFVKFPVKDNLPAPVKVMVPLLVKSPVPL